MIIKVPGINGLGKTKGCEKAPNFILDYTFLKTNSDSNLYSNLHLNLNEINLDNSNLEDQEIEIYNFSKKIFNFIKKSKQNLRKDLNRDSEKKQDEFSKESYNKVSKISYNEIFKGSDNETSNEKIIFLGGDHSISYPILNAFLEEFSYNDNDNDNKNKNKDNGLIIFDAHYDLMKPMKNPTHEEWLRALIENKNFTEVMLIGIRRNSKNSDDSEIKFAKEKKIKIIHSDEFEEKKSEILDFCKNKNIYVSIDLDVLDSSIFNSTGYPESEGLNEIQLLESIKELRLQTSFFDLVEYNPLIDSEKKGIKIIEKILKAIEGLNFYEKN